MGTHHDKLRYDEVTPPARSREIPFSLPNTPESIHVQQSLCVCVCVSCALLFLKVCGCVWHHVREFHAGVCLLERKRETEGDWGKGGEVLQYVCMCVCVCVCVCVVHAPFYQHGCTKTSVNLSITKRKSMVFIKNNNCRVTCQYNVDEFVNSGIMVIVVVMIYYYLLPWNPFVKALPLRKVTIVLL